MSEKVKIYIVVDPQGKRIRVKADEWEHDNGLKFSRNGARVAWFAQWQYWIMK